MENNKITIYTFIIYIIDIVSLIIGIFLLVSGKFPESCFLPFIFAITSIVTDRNIGTFWTSPLRYIIYFIFGLKFVLVPLFYTLYPIEIFSRVERYSTNAIILQIIEYFSVLTGYLIVKKIHVVGQFSYNGNDFHLRTNGVIFVTCIVLIYIFIIIRHPSFLAYFSFLDFSKSEYLMTDFHGPEYQIFAFISITLYLAVPLIITLALHKINKWYSSFLIMIVGFLPFVISTVNHWYSFVIWATIIIFLFRYRPNSRAMIFLAFIVGIIVIPPLIESKVNNTISLGFSVSSYVCGFLHVAPVFLMSKTNKLAVSVSDLLHSTPFVMGLISIKTPISSDIYNWTMFGYERYDQFIPMSAQLFYYIGSFFFFFYIFFMRFLTGVEDVVKTTRSPLLSIFATEYLIIFAYIVCTGNLNSFITTCFDFVFVYLLYKFGVSRS